MVKTDGIVIEDDLEPSAQPRPKKRRRTGNISDFSAVQRNMSKFGRGLFGTPLHGDTHRSSPPRHADLPKLPHRQLCEELIADYQSTFHQTFPFIDLQALPGRLDKVYTDWNTDHSHTEFVTVVFGIIACGSLTRHPHEGQKFFQAQKSMIDFWGTQPTLDLVRAMMLCSFYLTEMNEKSSAFRIIGHALRAAQDLGLHRKAAAGSMEEEVRESLWWSLYSAERYDLEGSWL